jgi:hypothetical protein
MSAKSIPKCASDNSLSRSKIYEQINKGLLIARKVDGRTIIIDEDERAWLRSLPKVVAAPAPDGTEDRTQSEGKAGEAAP